jgi:hypothetical protein
MMSNLATVLATVSYANAPALGAQYITIERQETGIALLIYFNEKRYNYNTQQDESHVHVYRYAAYVDESKYPFEQLVEWAKQGLQKHAGRSGYYGPMAYTVTEPAAPPVEQYEVILLDTIANTTAVLCRGTYGQCMVAYGRQIEAATASGATVARLKTLLKDGRMKLHLTNAAGKIVSKVFYNGMPSQHPNDRTAACLSLA